MSRGFGSVQREVLAAVEVLKPGEVVLLSEAGSSYRRAARRLASEGVISVRLALVAGRWCLVAEMPNSTLGSQRQKFRSFVF